MFPHAGVVRKHPHIEHTQSLKKKKGNMEAADRREGDGRLEEHAGQIG